MSDVSTRAGELSRLIWPLAKGLEDRPAHWIVLPSGDELYSKRGNDWCADCGYPIVQSIRRHYRKLGDERWEDCRWDGGWRTEHDTPPHCAGCGVKLQANLTFYGATYELDHFRENPPDLSRPSIAYEVSEMLGALEWVDERDIPIADEAIAIAEKALAAMTAGVPNG